MPKRKQTPLLLGKEEMGRTGVYGWATSKELKYLEVTGQGQAVGRQEPSA